jgi:hypothetical protein
LAIFIPRFGLLEVSLNRLKAILQLKQELLLLVKRRCLALPQILSQPGHLKLQFLYLVTLQVDELEHLEVFLLVLTEDS